MSGCQERLFRVFMFANATGAGYRAFFRAGRILGSLCVLVSEGCNLLLVAMTTYGTGISYGSLCCAGRVLGCLRILVSDGWNCFCIGISTSRTGKGFYSGCRTVRLCSNLALVGMGVLIFLNILRWNSNIRYISRRIISVNMSDIFSQFIIMI